MSWWSWFGTQVGRQFLQGSAIASSVAVFAGFHLPHSLLLDKYKEIVQSYERGQGQPVSPKTRTLFQDVLQDLKVSKTEQELLTPFTAFGFDLFHAGSTALRTGAIVGIPVNFSYEKESDVNRNIKIAAKSVPWESEAGELLLKSLVLSDDAKRFALAREVTSARSETIWCYSVFPSAAVILTYVGSRTLNDRLNTRSHPIRFVAYTLLSSFCFALYCTLTDLTTAYVESSADETAAQISPSYAKGGIEFYNKLRERNKVLRTLMGEAGEKLYSVTGNENIFLRIKTTPLSERLRALEELAKESTVQITENLKN